MTVEKLPPHDENAERDALGSCLLDAEALDGVAAIVTPDDFYTGANRRIFQAIVNLREADKAVDGSTVRGLLTDLGELEEVGGVGYLAELTGNLSSSAHARDHAERVKRLARLRRIIAMGTDYSRQAFDVGADPNEIMGALTQELTALEEGAGRDSDSIKDALRSIFASLDGTAQPANLLQTGIRGLDAKLCGLAGGDFVVLAAVTGGGKSTLGLNIVRNLCSAGHPCLVASYEMSREQIARTITAQVAQVCITKAGGYPEHRQDAVASALDSIAAWPFFVVDQPYTVQELTSKVRWYVRKHGVRVALIDYLQLVPTRGDADNREQEVASVSRALKRVARQSGATIIACSQLNDAGMMRESRAISHDADVLLKVTDPNPESQDISRHVQIRIEKNRDGETGAVEVLWERGYRTFRDWIPPAPDGLSAVVNRGQE